MWKCSDRHVPPASPHLLVLLVFLFVILFVVVVGSLSFRDGGHGAANPYAATRRHAGGACAPGASATGTCKCAHGRDGSVGGGLTLGSAHKRHLTPV